MRDIKILQSLPGHLQSTEGYKWKVRLRGVGKSAKQTLEQGMGCSRDCRPWLVFLLLLFLAPGKFLHSPKHSGWNIPLSSCQNKCAHDPLEGFFSWMHLPGMFTRERNLFCLISPFQAGCSIRENNFQTGYFPMCWSSCYPKIPFSLWVLPLPSMCCCPWGSAQVLALETGAYQKQGSRKSTVSRASSRITDEQIFMLHKSVHFIF